MQKETTQPLGEQPTRSTDDTKLVADVLGEEAAADMNELVGDRAKEPSVVPNEVGLSTGEKAATAEAEKTKVELRRDEYVIWATGISKDTDWVDETFTFESDGRVRVEGSLDLYDSGITELPGGLYEVTGNLILDDNNITSLESMPEIVGGDLMLELNQITSLKGMPKRIGDTLSLRHNQISSLEGMSEIVNGGINLGNNNITSLNGLPKIISKSIYLNDNQIESLVGLPDTIGGSLDLANNQISSLEGIPNSVGDNLHLSNNPQINSLSGISKVIDGTLNIRGIAAESIPSGLKIGKTVGIFSNQSKLFTDINAKGYNVRISV